MAKELHCCTTHYLALSSDVIIMPRMEVTKLLYDLLLVLELLLLAMQLNQNVVWDHQLAHWFCNLLGLLIVYALSNIHFEMWML